MKELTKMFKRPKTVARTNIKLQNYYDSVTNQVKNVNTVSVENLQIQPNIGKLEK